MDKEGYYIMIKWSILRENIILFNVYAPKNRASSNARKTMIKLLREIDKSTIIVKAFNTPLSDMGRSGRQKISKDMVELNSIINQLDKIDIYRLLHPKAVEYSFFSVHIEH